MGSEEGQELRSDPARRRTDDVQSLDVPLLNIEEEGRFLVDGAADVPAELFGMIARRRGIRRQNFKGIARIEGGVIPADHDLPVELVRAGLGEDFDAAVAQAVVLRGKRILVDANFADGGFRGKLARR